MVYIHRHSSTLRLDLSRLGELCRKGTKVLCAATSKLGNSSSYSVCAVRTPIYRSRLETFLLQKKSHTKWLSKTVIPFFHWALQIYYSGTSENGLPLLQKPSQCGQDSTVPNCIALYYSCYKETSVLRTPPK